VIVHFVDIGEMVDHHCLSFPFIRHQFGIKLYFIINSIAYESDRNIDKEHIKITFIHIHELN
jgi:hypothetical protein